MSRHRPMRNEKVGQITRGENDGGGIFKERWTFHACVVSHICLLEEQSEGDQSFSYLLSPDCPGRLREAAMHWFTFSIIPMHLGIIGACTTQIKRLRRIVINGAINPR